MIIKIPSKDNPMFEYKISVVFNCGFKFINQRIEGITTQRNDMLATFDNE